MASPHTHPASQHVRALLESLDLDAERDPELERTPRRFAELLADLTEGARSPVPTMSTFPAVAGTDETVMLCALPFYSLCVHHLMPFFGTIDVAYLPDAQIVGFGSIARLIDHGARRPQVQERLVQQIADAITAQLKPRGVLVRCRARQLCMEMRGSKKRGALLSYAASGVLLEGTKRDEAMQQFRSEERPL